MQVWDLVGRLGGQMRVAPSGGIIGWDMGAALAMARALSVPGVAVGELFASIGAGMGVKLNEQITDAAGEGVSP